MLSVNFNREAIVSCFSIDALSENLGKLQQGDWFIVDVDDTLITPKAMMFRPQSPYHDFIDDIKKAKPQNFSEILSTWRLNRETTLVEKQWPEILKALKAKGVTVVALTQMNTGNFGKIDSIEKWRANELATLNLTFSPFAMESPLLLIDNDLPATIYQGIMFTGSHSKAEVLKSFINKHTKPNQVMFVDDRLHQVESIAEFCWNTGISYYGYHYLATTRMPYD